MHLQVAVHASNAFLTRARVRAVTTLGLVLSLLGRAFIDRMKTVVPGVFPLKYVTMYSAPVEH